MSAISRKLKKMQRHEGREKLNVFTGIFLGVLCLYTVLMFLLLFWALMTALKSSADFRTNTYGFPREWEFGNFAVVLERISVPVTMEIDGVQRQVGVGILLQLIYSLLYSVGGAIIMAFVPCAVAYITCKFP